MANGALWIATAEQSRDLDRRARDEFGIPVRALMERAGDAIFEEIRRSLPKGGRIAFLCGKGNNGGDGLVAARLAFDEDYSVVCLIAGQESDLSTENCIQLAEAREAGVSPIFADEQKWTRNLELLSECDLLVDALLGTGAKGEIHGPIQEAIAAINRSGVSVIAVDIPSGILCDTGQELGTSVQATRTITFGLPKPFLFNGAGLDRSGSWSVAEIGFPEALLKEPKDAFCIYAPWVGRRLPIRSKNSHKGANGSVLIVAGSQGMTGAAVLAAQAAYRSGAGLVTVAAIPRVCEAVSAQIPEAIFLPLEEVGGAISPNAAPTLLQSQERFDSAIFGPGMTHSESVCALLASVWPDWKLPSVIDADALNAVGSGVTLPPGPCVLTPHPGELSRLLDCSADEVQANRFAAANHAAKAFGKTVVLKGAASLIAQDGEPLIVNTSGNPGMAVAGMGDVLSGVIGTLLAQGLSLREAAGCGVFWHGVAGDICATEIGQIGFTASEVSTALPRARATITTTCVSL